MKKSTRQLMALLMAGVMGASLTACGQGTDEKSTESKIEETAGTEEAKTEEAKTEAAQTEAKQTEEAGTEQKEASEASSEETTEGKSSEKAEAAGAVTISNEVGEKSYDVTYDSAPKRAVSVAGFTTEMMLALGLEEQMAGYSFQDNEILPEYADALGTIKCLAEGNPSQEVLLAEEPDFLTGWVSAFSDKNFSPEFCEENGIKIYVPRVEYPNATMDTVYEDYRNLGKIFQVEEKAEEVISGMQDAISAVQDKIKDKEKVSVFIYDSGEDAPFTASAGLPTDMIDKAGGVNVFAGTEKNWMGVSWEEVVAANPQYIIIMQYDMSDDVEGKENFLKNNEALKDIDAVKNDNIFILGLSDVVAGPRNTTAIETMAKEFHPDCFE